MYIIKTDLIKDPKTDIFSKYYLNLLILERIGGCKTIFALFFVILKLNLSFNRASPYYGLHRSSTCMCI